MLFRSADGAAHGFKDAAHFAVAAFGNGHAIPLVDAVAAFFGFDALKARGAVVQPHAYEGFFELVLVSESGCIAVPEVKAEVAELKAKSTEFLAKGERAEAELEAQLVLLPNLPCELVSPGKGAEDNEIVKMGSPEVKLPENSLDRKSVV